MWQKGTWLVFDRREVLQNIHRLAQLCHLEFLWLQKKADRGLLVQGADLVLNPLSAVVSPLAAESDVTPQAICK